MKNLQDSELRPTKAITNHYAYCTFLTVRVPVTCAAAKVLTDQLKSRHELLVDERRIGPWLQCILSRMKILMHFMPSL